MSKWEIVKLKDVVTIDKESILPSDIDVDSIYISLEDIEKDTGAFNTLRRAKDCDIKSNKFKFTSGHILYGKLRPNLNKVALPDFNGICSTDIYPIQTKKEVAYKRYIYHILHSKDFVKYASSRTNGANLPRVNEKIINEYNIYLPPLETQKQIAKTLDTVSELLAMRKQQLAELDNLIKSIFYDMFGDPLTNEKGWEAKKLGELSTLVSGGTPSRKHQEYFDGTIPWITTVSLGKTFIDETDAVEFINEKAILNSSTKLIKENSLLFGARVGIGKISINRVAMCTNQDIVSIVDVNQDVLNQVYLLNTIRAFADYFDRQKRGATIQGIKSETLKSINIPIPPMDLQIKFSLIVTKIEDQKALVQKAIDETQYLFDSFMSKYFD